MELRNQLRNTLRSIVRTILRSKLSNLSILFAIRYVAMSLCRLSVISGQLSVHSKFKIQNSKFCFVAATGCCLLAAGYSFAAFDLKDVHYILREEGFVRRTKTVVKTEGAILMPNSKKKMNVSSEITIVTRRTVLGITKKDGMKVARIECMFEKFEGSVYADNKKLNVPFQSLAGQKYIIQMNEKGKILERVGLEKISLRKELDTQILSGLESEIFASPAFPQKELGIGDSWLQKVMVPVSAGDPVELSGMYFVKGFEKRKGLDCLVIKMYTIYPLDSDIKSQGMKTYSRGVSEKHATIYFSKEKGSVIFSKWQDKIDLRQSTVYKDKGKTKKLTTVAELTVSATLEEI